MLPVVNYALNELKTVFQKSWEWRIGYVLIAGFIVARWLGLFSSLELIALDFFLRHRPAEGKDEHIVIVLIDRESIQGNSNLTDQQIVDLLNIIFEAEPAVVGLNIFRDVESDDPGRSQLIELFETHKNLIGVQKILPPREIPPIAGIPEEIAERQFGINDIPIDRDGRIRRVFSGAYLPDSDSNKGSEETFKFSFSFKVAQWYLEQKGYSLENLPSDPETPSFLDPQTGKFIKIPRVTKTFGGYVRDENVAKIQTLLNFRSGYDTFQVVEAASILNRTADFTAFTDKVVIIGGIEASFPNFLAVSAASNLIDEQQENKEILPRFGIVGPELEAHSTSQIINAVLNGRPLILAIHPILEDVLIVLAGVTGILIGNTFRCTQATIRNGLLLTNVTSLVLLGSYLLLYRLGLWVPVFPTASVLALTGITYIAFYQSERLAIMESKKLEEERRRAIERTFNSIHAGPLQTLASLLRNVRDGKIDQDCLLENLEALNQEIRGIGERLRQEAIEEVYFVDTRRGIMKLDLNHPMNEVFYELYSLCLQKDLPGFSGLKVRSAAFDPFDCQVFGLDIKRKLCGFLQESLENVGKHALGSTRLLVSGKITEGFYTLSIEDNGPGIQSLHVGEGTKFFQRLEDLLRGKFSRETKPTGGTICKLTWPLHKML